VLHSIHPLADSSRLAVASSQHARHTPGRTTQSFENSTHRFPKYEKRPDRLPLIEA